MALVEIDDLMRSYSRESFLSLASASGLKVHGARFQCPFAGCRDHRADRPTNVAITSGKDGALHINCFRCGGSGRYIDLYMAVKSLNFEQALSELRGFAATTPIKPRLRVVPSPPAEDANTLTPQEAARVWDSLAFKDDKSESYLSSRGLGDLPEGLVRFVTEAAPDLVFNRIAPNKPLRAQLKQRASSGFRIALNVKSVTGVSRGVQMRLAREPAATDRSKIISVTGTKTSAGFYGYPELIEASAVVVVAEGVADTLCVAQWVQGKASTCVVGAAGKNNLRRIVEECVKAGIDLEGRLFVLCPQNDRPVNASRREFDSLAKLAAGAKANVVWINTPDQYKDIAKWHEEAEFEFPAWPPLPVQQAMGLIEGASEDNAAAHLITPLSAVVAVPARFTVDKHEQDFSTLLAILDDPALRYGILHRQGAWEWNEMTQRPAFARTDLGASDWPALRAGLEQAGRATTTNKPLKWSEQDIQAAVMLLSRRANFHPVREWLSKLRPWNGVELLETTLARAMGLEEYSFEAALLKRWCVSAVARAFKPGSKVDTVLVLVGPQGTLKSTFFSVMGGEWFTDQSFDIHDKDGRMVIHSAWIVEWAELDTMRRSRDAEATKAFITQRVDKFRPPYARDLIEAPRSCVIVGTTNHDDFLTADPSGHRRFWPLKINNRIDVGKIGEIREALWAEAVAAFIAGEPWHLDVTLEEAARQHTVGFIQQDAWHSVISAWLDEVKRKGERSWVRTSDVLSEAIGKPPGQWTRSDEMRVAEVLTQAGWERKKRRVGDGKPTNIYVPSPTNGELFPPSDSEGGTK